MSNEEFNILQKHGFNSTFKRAIKYFATDKRYIYIILNELNYGKCPSMKYQKIVEFDVEISDWHDIKILKERGFTNLAITTNALANIHVKKWREISRNELPSPEIYLLWISRNGNICKIFSKRKAINTIRGFKSALNRIIYVHPSVINLPN